MKRKTSTGPAYAFRARSPHRRSLIGAAVLALVMPGGAGLALAHQPCDPTDNDRAEASRVLVALTNEIDFMEAAIVEALRLQTGQLSGYQAQSAKVVMAALDAQTHLQAQIAREVEETKAMRARRPSGSGCAAVTGLRGLVVARRAAEAAGRRATSVETGRIISDRAVVAHAGSAAANAARFEVVTGEYCNNGRAGGNAALCRGDAALHAADLMPATLFGKRTFASEAELRAAVELSRNLAAPVVHDRPPLASAETVEERRRILLGRAVDARQALAADYFSRARGLRAPGPALGAWAAEVAPGLVRDANAPLSRYELLEIMAARRFEDPNWYVGLQAMSEANLLRELVIQTSVSLMLDWERYRLDELRGAMDAAGLGAASEAMRRPPGLASPAAGRN